MKPALLLLLFVYATGFSQSQITGNISNSEGENLTGASVIFKDNKGRIITYTITNDKGVYVTDIRGGTYFIEVNFLGYKTQSRSINVTNEQKLVQDFILLSSNEELQEVIIDYEQPVKLRGDTLVFDAESYTTGTETVVEDLLKNIPGITVEKDGTIRYNDKTIEKVMVEGDDLFNKGYSLLTRNMPDKPLKNVEVLKNYSNNKLLKGIEDSNNVALNLTLEDDFKNIWFGNAEVGYGEQNRYLVNGSLMNFTEKHKTFLTTSFNNAGYDKVGNPDAMVSNSVDLESIGHGFRATQVMHLGFKVPRLDAGRTRFNNAEMATLSTIFPLGSKAKLKLIGFLGFDELKAYQHRHSVTHFEDTYFENVEANNSRNKIRRSYINALLNYDVSPNQLLQSSTTVNLGQSNFNNDYSFNGARTREELETGNTFFDQKATYTHKWKDRSAVLVKTRFFTDKLPQNYGINDYLLGNLFPHNNIHAIGNEVMSNKEYAGLQADFRLKQKNDDLISFAVGFDQNNDNLSTSFTLFTDGGNMIPEDFQSDILYKVGDLYARSGYTLKFDNFSIGGNLNIHHLINEFEDKQGATKSQNPFFINPTLSASWQLKPNNVLRGMYSHKISNSNLLQVNNNYLLTSSRSFSKGLGYFNQWENSSANIGFTTEHYLNRYKLSINLDYSKQNDVIAYRRQINQNSSLSEAFIVKGGDRAGIRFSSHYIIKKLSGILNLKGSLGRVLYYNQVNSPALRKNILYSQVYTFGWTSNFKSAFNFDFATEWSFSQIKSGNIFNNTSKTSYLNLEYVVNDNFNIKFRNEHYNFGGLDRYNHYFFADIEALYSFKEQKYSIGLDGRNLFNTDTFTTYSISDIGYATNSYRLLPRYVLLKFKFRF